MPVTASNQHDRQAATADESENAAAPAKPRAPWQAPRLTRFPIARTELGGTVGNEGNGVFAFTEIC
jgi:hypothetical protein